MRKFIIIFVMAVLVLSYANAAGIREERALQEAETGGTMSIISDITGQNWNLLEVYIDGLDTQFNRSSLPNELRTCFTLRFDGQTVRGTGAPNLYSAPFTMGDNQTVSIKPMISTLMAPLFEPENLTERNFFIYLQNSHSWRVVNNRMELLSKTADNRDVRLVFGL